MTIAIAGAQVVGGHGLRRADVVMDGPTIAAVGRGVAGAGRVLEGDGLLVAPGFIDLQVNGAIGQDLTTDPDALWEVAAALPRYGVSAFLPTTITAPLDTYARALPLIGGGPPPGWEGAIPIGWHLEGPMLNPARRGAHPARHLRPPGLEVYGRWSRGRGVALVTIAPELPGALEAIRHLTEAGVVVSAGHTDATTREINDGIAAGVTYLTHLFNAMPPLAHREPGPVGVALAGGPLVCGLIADGLHVEPIVVRAAWRALGPTRLNLVSDAAGALGMPDGAYRLGATAVRVGADGVRNGDGALAGSNLALDQAVRNLVSFTGCEPHEAIATVTSTAAAVLGTSHKGRVEAGADADLVILTPQLDVVATIVAGEVVHSLEASWTS